MATCEGAVMDSGMGIIASARTPVRARVARAPSGGRTPRARKSSTSQSAAPPRDTTTTLGGWFGLLGGRETCWAAEEDYEQDRQYAVEHALILDETARRTTASRRIGT